MKITQGEYKILNMILPLFIHILYFVHVFFVRKCRFSSYFIYSRKSDLQVARNTKVELDAKKLLGFI